jgi:UDP-2-acetamido-3-amino-2,3-dideoxy-glucuronate N-acetyltransferase
VSGTPARTRDRVTIGRFCIVDDNATIGPDSVLDDYTAVYGTAVMGRGTRLLYGAKVFDRAEIGDWCIIGGDISERAVLEDRVTFMGRMAHSHYNPASDWDTTDEPSAYVEEGAVIGDAAILIGGIRVGRGAYVGAGEILRHDLPPHTVLVQGRVVPISHFRGLIRSRVDEAS